MVLDFGFLFRKYDLDIKGIVHVGAHFGQEYDVYRRHEIKKIIFFEPQPHAHNELKRRFGGSENVVIEKYALGSNSKLTDMYIETANNGMSSSLLKPKVHLRQYPHIQFTDTIRVNQITLDEYFDKHGQVDVGDYNFMNIDVQGYELEVLKGATLSLRHIDYIMAEVNKAELYENCTMVDELDEFLAGFGFERVETNWAGVSWGDAFYVKSLPSEVGLLSTKKQNALLGMVFSKDRAMQLDGTLRSLLIHCKGSESIDLKVLYTTSNEFHERQYRQLMTEYDLVEFIRERNFKQALISILSSYQYVLFLVDDNIFVRDFRFLDVVGLLESHLDAIGFSLRLGRNNSYYYMLDREQRPPHFHELGQNILKYDWTKAHYDFGFPLEVSSSVYRISDLWPLLARTEFSNPNTLELMLAQHKGFYENLAGHLLCYDRSVAFCNPVNRVNTVCECRSGNEPAYLSESLADLFEKGLRIDVKAYVNFIPNACHQEVELHFCKAEQVSSMPPLSQSPVPLTSHRGLGLEDGGGASSTIESIKWLEGRLAEGERLFQDGRFDEAEGAFRDVLKSDSRHAKAHNDLACVLWETGRSEEALQQLTRAMEITPDDRDAVWNVGHILRSMGRDQDARHVYDAYLKRHPKDQEMAEAVCRLGHHGLKVSAHQMPSVSVIIPVFNCEKTLINTLKSVKRSLDHCAQMLGRLDFEIIIVDDHSSDNTVLLAEEFISNLSGFLLISNSDNYGAGASRNKGVKYSKGELLFFLDGDDTFLEGHICLCVHFMMRHPEVHFVQTKVCVDEAIHPDWQARIENSLPLNVCVRRECHDLVGGFPEGKAFKILRCEDVVYRSLLSRFFMGHKIEKETVHYFRYPGNALDRQMERFSRPPNLTADMDTLTDTERDVLPEINRVFEERSHELERTLKAGYQRLCPKEITTGSTILFAR
jgi:FkbM family methyltransferase